MKDIDLQLQKSLRLIYWLIDGIGIHCIPLYLWKSVTIEWVVENYNVELEYFCNVEDNKRMEKGER